MSIPRTTRIRDMIRLATGDDSDAIIALIDSVLREYNDRVFLDDADADLLDLAASYFAIGGSFWVLELDGRVAGTHAAKPDHEPGTCVFRRLYLEPQLRGSQWGQQLMQVTLDWAMEQGFDKVHFWSDTRFDRAHRFFARFGFQRDGRVRQMDDGWQPYEEYYFSLALTSRSCPSHG